MRQTLPVTKSFSARQQRVTKIEIFVRLLQYDASSSGGIINIAF
jgi:hypothetical protein